MTTNIMGEIVLCRDCPARYNYLGPVTADALACVGPKFGSSEKVYKTSVYLKDADGATTEWYTKHFYTADCEHKPEVAKLLADVLSTRIKENLPRLAKAAVERVGSCEGMNNHNGCPAIGGFALEQMVNALPTSSTETE